VAEVYGAEVSRQTISTITDKVIEGMVEWQNRPLDPVYPVIDAIHVKIRDGQVANRPINVALAVACEGRRDILGLWAGDGGKGAKHWLHVLTELKNRGVADVLMVVCDGLTGLPDAITTVWPATITQTCVVHLLRNSFRYAGRQHWDAIAKALKPVCTAATEAAARERFAELIGPIVRIVVVVDDAPACGPRRGGTAARSWVRSATAPQAPSWPSGCPIRSGRGSGRFCEPGSRSS
jgi:putative transposase